MIREMAGEIRRWFRELRRRNTVSVDLCLQRKTPHMKVQRARLGTLDVRQEAPELPVLVTRTVKAKVEPGDAILWRVRLREFGALNGRECFQLLAIVEPGE